MGEFILGHNKQRSNNLKIPALDTIVEKYDLFKQESIVMSKVLVEIYLSNFSNAFYSEELFAKFFHRNPEMINNNGLFVVENLLKDSFSKIDLNPSVVERIKEFHSEEEKTILEYYSQNVYEESKTKKYFRRKDTGEKYQMGEMINFNEYKRVLDISIKTINSRMNPKLDENVMRYILKKLFPNHGVMTEDKLEPYIYEKDREIKKNMNFAFFDQPNNHYSEINKEKVILKAWPIWKSGKLWTNTRKKNEEKYSLLTEVISSSDIKAIFGNTHSRDITPMYIIDVLKKKTNDFGVCDTEEKAKQMTQAINRKVINDLEVKIYLTGRGAKKNFELFHEHYDKTNKIKLLDLHTNIKKFNTLPPIMRKYILAKTHKDRIHLYDKSKRGY